MIEDVQSRLRRMRERYVERVRAESSRIEELVRAMDDTNADAAIGEIERLAHGLAGSAGTFGFEEIGVRAGELERKATNVRRGGSAPSSIAGVVVELATAVSRIGARSE